MEYTIKGVILNNEMGKVICFQGRAGSVEGEAYCTKNCAAFQIIPAPLNPVSPIEMGISTRAILHCCKREINIKEISE